MKYHDGVKEYGSSERDGSRRPAINLQILLPKKAHPGCTIRWGRFA